MSTCFAVHDPRDTTTKRNAGIRGRAVNHLRQRSIEDVVDEGGLARARDARDAGQRVERDANGQVLQVVLARAADDEGAAASPARPSADPLTTLLKTGLDLLTQLGSVGGPGGAAGAAPGASCPSVRRPSSSRSSQALRRALR